MVPNLLLSNKNKTILLRVILAGVLFFTMRAANAGQPLQAAAEGLARTSFSAPAYSSPTSPVTSVDEFPGLTIKDIDIPFIDTVDTTEATTDTGGIPDPSSIIFGDCDSNKGTASVWYNYKPEKDNYLQVETIGSDYDTVLAIWKENLGNLALVACSDDISLNELQSKVEYYVQANTNYYIEVIHYSQPALQTQATGNTLKFSVHTSTFVDVPYSHMFWRYIEAFYGTGITVGCSQSPLMYCPNNPVTRGEMAVFIERALGNFLPAPSPTGMFTDIPYPGMESFTTFIEQYYNDGLTVGCMQNPLRYCPQNYVTRGEMAVFIERALGNFAPTPSPTGMFADIPYPGMESFTPFVEEFYNDGITVGCTQSPLRYCPQNYVTRGEMAVFIVRAFGIPLP